MTSWVYPVLPRLKGRCFQVDPARLTGRLDAVRQDPDYEFVLSRLRRGKYPLVEVSTVARNTTKPIRPSDNPARPFIPVDLEDIDPTYGQIVPPEPRLGIDFGPDTRVRLLPGDLAVNRLRFYLRKVAVVPQTSDWVGTGELYSFRLQCTGGCHLPVVRAPARFRRSPDEPLRDRVLSTPNSELGFTRSASTLAAS